MSRTAAGVRGSQRPPEKTWGASCSNRQSFHPAVSKSALNRREMRADQNWPRGFGTLTGIRSSTFWQGRTRGTGPRCWRSWPGIGGSGWPRKSPCGFRSLPRITARSRLADSPGPSGQDPPAGVSMKSAPGRRPPAGRRRLWGRGPKSLHMAGVENPRLFSSGRRSTALHKEESRYGSRQNRPCVSTGPELLLFGDKQPQGPNANRAVKPDGRGKICSRFGRIKHYIARPAGAVMLRNADAQQKSTFSAFARSVLARDPGDDATRPAAVPSHGSGGASDAGSAASASS